MLFFLPATQSRWLKELNPSFSLVLMVVKHLLQLLIQSKSRSCGCVKHFSKQVIAKIKKTLHDESADTERIKTYFPRNASKNIYQGTFQTLLGTCAGAGAKLNVWASKGT